MKTTTTTMTEQEETALSESLAEIVAAIQKARQQIEQDHRETDASKQRTWAMLNEMQRRFQIID
jgi:hypothetical protein